MLVRLYLFILLLCPGVTRVSVLNLKAGCSSYKIGGLHVEVKNGTKAWCSVIQSREVGNCPPTTPVVEPKILLGKEQNLNITWVPSPRQDHRLPKWYLMKLTKVERIVSSFVSLQPDVYILLRLKHRRRAARNQPPALFFPCVELTKEPNSYLMVQIWPFSNRPALNKSKHYCQVASPKPLPVQRGGEQANRRSQRSVAVSKTCRNIMEQIQCSVEEMAPLSLDPYKPIICHCSGQLNLTLRGLPNNSLQVSVWNLPQYAYNIDINIYDENGGHKSIYNISLAGTNTVNESRIITTDSTFCQGSYSATAHAQCAGDHEDLLKAGTDCPLTNKVRSKILHVTSCPPSKPLPFRMNNIALAGVLAITAFTTATTLIIFYVRKSRQMSASHGLKIEIPQNNQIRSQATEAGVSTVADKGLQESVTTTFELPLPQKTEAASAAACSIYRKYEKLSEPFDPRLDQKLLSTASKKTNKMLLYHPDHQSHVAAVEKLRNLLRNSFGIHLSDGAHSNWRDFAESAGKQFTDIVIVLSPRLLELCKAYEDKAVGLENKFETLRKERCYEYIPCVAMKTLQTLTQENPDKCMFSLRFVLFGSDSFLLEDFKSIYNFLKRTASTFDYKLLDDSADLGENGFLKASLEQLILRLRG